MLERLRIVLEMIKIEHTLFAMPFAFIGALLAARGLPSGRVIFWIIVAMVGARSAAMAFNRLVDREFDAKNPRTAQRALPAGLVSAEFVTGFTVFSALLLILAAWQLNALALALSPLALLIIFFYSLTKRFSHWSHAFLGIALAIAPVGAWVAVKGAMELTPLLLGVSVVFWLIGFDILYALQDLEFDRSIGLKSVPARYGAEGALKIARASHVLMVLALLATGVLGKLGAFWHAGVALSGALIAAEHHLVRPDDLKRLNIAFFNVNVAVGAVLLLATLGEVFWR